MPPSLCDVKPKPGDLIEIFRGRYQHWAIYVGNGYVIHLAPPSEFAGAGAHSVLSVLCDKAIVKKEELWELVGSHSFRVNNLLDDEYNPRSIHIILREANSLLGQELPYCLFRGNCEHFVTELRYGKGESRQVRNAVQAGVGVGIAGLIGIGAVAVIASIIGSGRRERSNTE